MQVGAWMFQSMSAGLSRWNLPAAAPSASARTTRMRGWCGQAMMTARTVGGALGADGVMKRKGGVLMEVENGRIAFLLIVTWYGNISSVSRTYRDRAYHVALRERRRLCLWPPSVANVGLCGVRGMLSFAGAHSESLRMQW
ncbi:hypothetical protein PLICRDRAFT_382812 [Plicaturopsis crispa FD-325 SS-3]|nr:hypothetical protein PLICRDRAFT_382812 [Plicaturopsis crispa FD-325 SS-3]